ncbi:class I SAM-dependent methyltransferase [Sphingomonas immobilis]|uniref:Class I SAM-dependent methyltransferase n=1 Tax=Sphingomonas immobilis TaxID=3063997 RepID=A0ABT8ZUV8_9SPHN|nr:class I SAM-dependent methyltransferase [Sphingomonas sp. CA1-15]MDO7840919.1 class I SAM-dependent methyltransferase [Sphingomonas sp. CA1-15]
MFERLIQKRPRIDIALSAIDKARLKLPILDLSRLFPHFDETPVTINQVPLGQWSAPLADVMMLMKLVACAKPMTMMEVGSYRGFTALMMARHAPTGAHLTTVDREPQHGEAYRTLPEAAMITRRVCEVTTEAFAGDAPGSYDLIFLDADHSYAAVKRDSEILLPLVKPGGYLVWHDYGNWGKFSGHNGVPEYLHELSATIPVAVVAGSQLGIHSPAWGHAQAAAFKDALVDEGLFPDPWASEVARG